MRHGWTLRSCPATPLHDLPRQIWLQSDPDRMVLRLLDIDSLWSSRHHLKSTSQASAQTNNEGLRLCAKATVLDSPARNHHPGSCALPAQSVPPILCPRHGSFVRRGFPASQLIEPRTSNRTTAARIPSVSDRSLHSINPHSQKLC